MPRINELPVDVSPNLTDLLALLDVPNNITKQVNVQSIVALSKSSTLTVVASTATAQQKNIADYVCTGTADQIQINAAISALPSGKGKVRLGPGNFSTTATISMSERVTLEGAGMEATTITGTGDFDVIHMGNRQADGHMRDYMRLIDMTVTHAGGASTGSSAVWVDGGGQSGLLMNVVANQGKWNIRLTDLDRFMTFNINCNNPRTAGILCETGLENTWGTVTFIDTSVALSDASSICVLWDTNPNQGSPNKFDRVEFLGGLFYATAGVAGTIGMKTVVGITALTVRGVLYENNIQHNVFIGQVQGRWDGASFIQNSGISTDGWNLSSTAHTIVVDTCRLQQMTNVFNGVSGNPIVCLMGINNNQGNLTNIFTGSFGSKRGTDTVFAGDGNLSTGLDNQRFSYGFINNLVGNPLTLQPNGDSTTGIKFLKADRSTIVAQVDTTNSMFLLEQVGGGFGVKEGTNAKMGTGVLTAGTVVVSTTKVTATSRIFVTAQTVGGTAGALAVTARTAGTSFTVTSTSGTDTSTFAWFIVEPS